MLLRLRVQGFKNLRDVEIRFGALTCFVGPNGVGKSNIFDAIQFLRRLADEDIQTAAESVRSPARGGFGPRELFWSASPTAEMSFEADIVTPGEVVDDFGVRVEPAITLLRYSVTFGIQEKPRPRLELRHEELRPHRVADARDLFGFPHAKAFREDVVRGRRFGGAFISTRDDASSRVIVLHGDKGRRGRPAPAGESPRTILGGTNTNYYPTVLAARREMSSWHALHLEPSFLRSPDSFSASDRVDEHGAHIAAALHRLARRDAPGHEGGLQVSESAPTTARADVALCTTAEVANRLARLVPEVRDVRIDEDPLREQRTVQVRMRGSDQWFGPRSLSDGTLRFLALVTMQLDPEASRVLCMEEPENGIHPSRIPAIVDLLDDFAVDPSLPVATDNPVRQVIVNTHSPEVLRRLAAHQVLFVDAISGPGGRHARVRPVGTDDNWRGGKDTVSLRSLAAIIGGAPLGRDLEDRQLALEFGTAE